VVQALAVRAGSRRVKTFHIGFEEAAFGTETQINPK